MARKGLSVWIFSSLTFVALIHLMDAISALVFNNPIKLFQLYPFAGDKLLSLPPSTYFWISAAVAFTLWGITCSMAFENPLEIFLKRILTDAKAQGAVETKLVEQKSEVLDAIFDATESSNDTLAQVKDLVYNVRAEAKEIRPIRENMEKMKAELSSLKRDFKKIEDKTQVSNRCPACAKPLMPEFKICPYCGENIKFLPPEIITVKDYR